MKSLWKCRPAWLVLLALTPGLRARQITELSIADAVERALSGHAAVGAAAARVSGAGALALQAGLRPNPTLAFQSENWRFTGTPSFRPSYDLDLFAYLTQPLETGGKRTTRVNLAKYDLRLAELEKQAVEWQIRQEVRRAFLRALLAQKQLDLLQENGRYFEQIITYHRMRVEQGAMPEVDLIRVMLERDRLSIAENAAAAEAGRARADLLKAMGAREASADFRLAEPAAATPTGPPLDLAGLLARANSRRMELILGQARIERARAQVDLERALVKPDWSVVFGYKRTTGYDTLLAGVFVPLPLFNRNQGNIGSSLAEVTRAESTLRADAARAQAEILAALTGLRRSRAMIGQMEKGMVERAEESLRISLAAYREGGADLLRLLDAQRVRNEVQFLFMQVRMEYLISMAELENAVGEENLSLAEELFRVPS